MSGFDSFIASQEIRISFLIHMHILFSPLSSVTIFSDITIILISNNLYLYLLKLLQINGCACLNYCGIVEESISVQMVKSRSIYLVNIPPPKMLRICPTR